MPQLAAPDPDQDHQTSVPTDRSPIAHFHAEAQTRLEKLDWPKRTDENWRFADLKRSKIEAFIDAPASQPIVHNASEQIRILTLEEAFANHGDRVREQLAKIEGRLGSQSYMARAQASGQLVGTCIVIPSGLEVSEPITLVREVEGDFSAAHSLTIVLAEANSKVTIFERLQSRDDGSHLAIHASAISSGDGAKTTYVLSQELSDTSKFVHAAHAETGRDATIRTFFGNFGCDWVRQECVAELAAPGADCELLGLNIADETQEIDQRTLQHHASGHAQSNLLFKNALFGKAKTIFAGLIQVDDGAHHTDSFQTCRNLLLSDEAEANALPGLEINADQVSCSHGATTGQIDPEQLFYLLARGIPERAARRLITMGFANETILMIENDSVQEILGGLVAGRIESLVD